MNQETRRLTKHFLILVAIFALMLVVSPSCQSMPPMSTISW